MTKIILHGCNGRMGKVVSALAAEDPGIEVAAGVDSAGVCEAPYPFFSGLAACDAAADVVVDFSVAAAADALLKDCTDKGLPLVLCTTGLSEKQLAQVEEASQKIAVLRSANMSLGVNVLLKLLREIAPVFDGAGFDIEVTEKHHNRKLDAPSGTAIALADAVNDGLGAHYAYVYDRSGRRMERPQKEIGISAVRGGSIVGDHDVIFAGTDEVVTLSHRAYSRAIFAKGAIAAAKFLAGKPAGMYSMADVVG